MGGWRRTKPCNVGIDAHHLTCSQSVVLRQTAEIPPLTEKLWKNAVRNPFRRRAKEQLTVRLDSDVVAWLQRPGADYQSRLNGLLRKAMQAEIHR